ncbi:MAG: efflux RND transporter periplasmic adaptor subunit [Burkholderiales bacterium]|nr:efflux RND transporter periplasmic adaptor subunit [Burkholderiales bacterium]
MKFNKGSVILLACAAIIAASLLAFSGTQKPAAPKPAQIADQSLDLTDEQLKSVKVGAVVAHPFTVQREAVGNIAFDDDMTVQVFPPYPGKIIERHREIGDTVKKGDVLFVINSPDLVQAESNLITTAGVKELTTRALDRAKDLLAARGIAQKDYQQAVSDQQGAEGAYNAARNALHIFGKSDAEIDRIVAERKVDSALPVPSPISGQVTVIAMAASVGTFVQPGTAPAPYAVSDLSTMWMVANVPESDIPLLHQGEAVEVKVMAYPDKVFHAKITKIGAMVDPNTHRIQVRTEVRDPGHELHAGMFATFLIRMGNAVRSAAAPLDGVVREGDGTNTVWVTTDRRRFTRRTVKLGVQQDGMDQIIEGLKPGELIATDGAIFLSNALVGNTSSNG